MSVWVCMYARHSGRTGAGNHMMYARAGTSIHTAAAWARLVLSGAALHARPLRGPVAASDGVIVCSLPLPTPIVASADLVTDTITVDVAAPLAGGVAGQAAAELGVDHDQGRQEKQGGSEQRSALAHGLRCCLGSQVRQRARRQRETLMYIQKWKKNGTNLA